MSRDPYRRIEELEARVDDLEFMLGEIRGLGVIRPDWFWGSDIAFAMVNVLSQKAPRCVSRQALMTAMYPVLDQPRPKILDVFVSKSRKVLGPRGIEIRTHVGRGYSLTEEGADRWRAELERFNPGWKQEEAA